MHAQVSFSSKAGFYSELKTGQSDSPQTLNPAFLVMSLVASQLKKNRSKPFRLPENAYLVALKVGVIHTYVNSNPEALLQQFSGNNALDRL